MLKQKNIYIEIYTWCRLRTIQLTKRFYLIKRPLAVLSKPNVVKARILAFHSTLLERGFDDLMKVASPFFAPSQWYNTSGNTTEVRAKSL